MNNNNDQLVGKLLDTLLNKSGDIFEKTIAYSRLLSLGYKDAELLEICLLKGKVIASSKTKKNNKPKKSKATNNRGH
jgi:hypothetical protein